MVGRAGGVSEEKNGGWFTDFWMNQDRNPGETGLSFILNLLS